MKTVIVICMLVLSQFTIRHSKVLSTVISRGLIRGFVSKQSLRMQTIPTTSSTSSSTSTSIEQSNKRINQVIVLAGATSAGKSAVVRELTKFIHAEIIVADSVQIYKYANIGANKPSIEEQLETSHHLVDLFEPSVILSSGEFVRLATAKVMEILDRGKTPIIVGGCTMWLDWLIHGIPDAPRASTDVTLQANKVLEGFEERNAWNEALTAVSEYLTSLLSASSTSTTLTSQPSLPDRFKNLANNDWYRLRRYLEIELALHQQQQTQEGEQEQTSSSSSSSSSSSLSGTRKGGLLTLTIPSSTVTNNNNYDHSNQLQSLYVSPSAQSHSVPLDVRCFFLSENRQDLYQTIDKRCVDMLHNGLLEEVTDMVLKNQMSGSSGGSSETNSGSESNGAGDNFGDDIDDSNDHSRHSSAVADIAADSSSLTTRPLVTLTPANTTLPATSTSAVTESMVAKAIGYRQTLDFLLNPHRYNNSSDINNNNNNNNMMMMMMTEDDDIHTALENFVKEFSSATRNYAKRQLQWYRSDSAFLWLEIFRQPSITAPSSSSPSISSSTTLTPSPYQTICQEILHWINPNITSLHDFQQMIQYQSDCGKCVTDIRNRKRVHNGDNSNTKSKKKQTKEEKLAYRKEMEMKYGIKKTTTVVESGSSSNDNTGTITVDNAINSTIFSTSSSPSSQPPELQQQKPTPSLQKPFNHYNMTRQFYYYPLCVQSLINKNEIPVAFWEKEQEKIKELKQSLEISLQPKGVEEIAAAAMNVYRESGHNVNEAIVTAIPSYVTLADKLMTDRSHSTITLSALDPLIRASEGLRSSAALMTYNQSYVVQQLLGNNNSVTSASGSGKSKKNDISNSGSNKDNNKKFKTGYNGSNSCNDKYTNNATPATASFTMHASDNITDSNSNNKTYKHVLQRVADCVQRLNDEQSLSDEAKLFIQTWRFRHLTATNAVNGTIPSSISTTDPLVSS